MKVKKLIKNRNFKVRAIAKGLDVSTQAVYQLLDREVDRCQVGTLKKIAGCDKANFNLRKIFV